MLRPNAIEIENFLDRRNASFTLFILALSLGTTAENNVFKILDQNAPCRRESLSRESQRHCRRSAFCSYRIGPPRSDSSFSPCSSVFTDKDVFSDYKYLMISEMNINVIASVKLIDLIIVIGRSSNTSLLTIPLIDGSATVLCPQKCIVARAIFIVAGPIFYCRKIHFIVLQSP